jgi:hypothetical protein
MLQQIQVTSTGPAAIKPLIEAAIRGQLRTLEYGIQRTRERLAQFEQQFNMTSIDFERDFDLGQLEETLDYIEWSGEIKTLHLLEDQLLALQSARIK